MSRHEALACAVLQMVIVQKNPAVGLIVHSDRGMQLRFKELSQHQLVEHPIAGHSMVQQVFSIPEFCEAGRCKSL